MQQAGLDEMVELTADQENLKRCISGNRKALEEFVRRFSDPVYKWIQYTLKVKNIAFSRQDLEDLHNTVFLKLLDKRCKKLRQYEGKNGCSVFSWIRLITIRTVIDHIRKIGKDVMARPETLDLIDNLPDLTKDGFEALSRMEKVEQADLLMQGLQDLLPRDRLFLKLHCLHGLPIQQVADMMKISEGNAYSLKHRAINRLRTKIGRYAKETG